jgi:hypothetical protein
MGAPEGFAWVRRKGGEVVITHHGTHAAVLRGVKADAFAADAADAADASDLQELMARLTGNYKHGNERRAGRRSRGRAR